MSKGLSVGSVIFWWSSPAQSFLVPGSAEVMTILLRVYDSVTNNNGF
jgi:hypothetical protein